MKYLFLIAISICLFSCRDKKEDVFQIANKNGMRAVFCAEGARIMSLYVRDKNGRPTNVVIGFDSAPRYTRVPPNRISAPPSGVTATASPAENF